MPVGAVQLHEGVQDRQQGTSSYVTESRFKKVLDVSDVAITGNPLIQPDLTQHCTFLMHPWAGVLQENALAENHVPPPGPVQCSAIAHRGPRGGDASN